MIRINLAKTSSIKSGSEGGAKSGKWIVVSVILLLLVAGAASLLLFIPRSKPVQQVATAAPAPSVETPKPSTHLKPNMIENVVKEIGSESRTVRKFNLAYDDMSAAEKINYEVLFGKNALELVGRAVPSGIRLRSLEIENFQSVYANGLGATRELVSEMFAAFKSEKVEVLPVPLSYIKDDPNSDNGYSFVVTCKAKFGIELDPFQALDHLGFKEGLSVHLKNFNRLASENNVKFKVSPRQVSAERTGSYRRVTYRVEGTTTYRDFNQFVLALYKEKIPCAFKKISLVAKDGSTVQVVTEILFTVKE